MADLGSNVRSYDLKPPSSDSTDEPFSWSTGNSHAFQVDSDEKLRIAANGKVGIGTDDPSEKLDVRGDIIAYTSSLKSVKLQTGNGGAIELTNNNGGFIDFKTSDSEDFDCRIRQQSNGITFETGGNGSTEEALRITGTGSVGIGTEIPTSVLEVAADAAVLTITDTRSQTFSVGDIMSSLAFDTDDASGRAGSTSHP